MNMNTWLWIYFLVNAFMAGVSLGKSHGFGETKKERIITILSIVVALFAAVPFNIIAWTWEGLKALDHHFQLRFFWQYWFTKRWDFIREDELKRRNNITRTHFNGKSIHNRMYRYCMRLINRRNGFIPEENEHPEASVPAAVDQGN